MSKAIAMSKPRAKKEMDHSYGIAKSLIIAVARAKIFPKLQLQAKLKTKLCLKTGLD